MNKAIAKLSVLLGADNNAFKKSMNDSKKSLGAFGGAVKDFQRMFVAAFSVAAITSFAKASVEAYKIQEMAEAKLLKALGGRSDVMQSLTAQASKLQGVTTFGDERTLEAQAQLALVLGANESAIRTLTPLIQDFAAAMNLDLGGAAKLVSKTLGSATNALAEYGLMVNGAVGSQERLDSVTAALTSRFEGQARVAGETLTGQLERLKNTWGDVQEEFGRFVLTKVIDLEEWSAFFTVMNSPDATRAQKWIVAFADLFPGRAEQIVEDIRSIGTEVESLGTTVANLRLPDGPFKEMERDVTDLLAVLTAGSHNMRPIEVVPQGDTLAKFREELKDLNTLRENASLSEIAGINKQIEALEKKIKAYSDLGKAMTMPEVNDVPSWLQGFSDQESTSASNWSPWDGIDWTLPEEEFDSANDTLVNKFTEMRHTIDEFNRYVEGSFEDMVATIADSLGSSIVSGDFQGFFSSILTGFGNFAQNMGKMLIAYGISMDAFKKSFANPYAAIAAGAALVAIGAAIKGAANTASVGSSGGGSPVTGSSGMTSNNFSNENRTVELVWKRAGNDLVAIFNDTNFARNTLTGTGR